jgi:hypothetical protein
MTDKQRRYLSYLLRLWQEWDRLPAVWRASLEDPHTGERLGFADVAQLFAFLEDQVSGEHEPNILHPPSGRGGNLPEDEDPPHHSKVDQLIRSEGD